MLTIAGGIILAVFGLIAIYWMLYAIGAIVERIGWSGLILGIIAIVLIAAAAVTQHAPCSPNRFGDYPVNCK